MLSLELGFFLDLQALRLGDDGEMRAEFDPVGSCS